MTDVKISALSNNNAVADADEVAIVDKSNTTNQATGETEKRTALELKKYTRVKRVTTETSSATPSTNVDNADIHRVTALAVNITSMSTGLTGTPTFGQMVLWEITGTATRTIAWGASFANTANYTWPATTVGTTPIKALGMWNGSVWECVGVI